MKRVAQPGHTARTTFELCVSSVKDVSFRERLRCVAARIDQAEDEYRTYGHTAAFHEIIPESAIDNRVTKEEMIKMYTGQLSRLGSPSRHI